MRFRNHLRKLAKTSKHYRSQHAALVAKGKSVLAQSTNTEGHHAEASALASLWSTSAAKGATLYTLMRRTKSGSLGNGAPCPACMDLIKAAKIRRVVVYV